MPKFFLIFFVMLFSFAPAAPDPKPTQNLQDLRIIEAQHAINSGDQKAALKIYEKLYAADKNPEFARMLALLNHSQASKTNAEMAFFYAKIYYDSPNFVRDYDILNIIFSHYERENDKKSIEKILQHIKNSPSPKKNPDETDSLPLFLGTSYARIGDFSHALPELLKFYRATRDERTMFQILNAYEITRNDRGFMDFLAEYLKHAGCENKNVCMIAFARASAGKNAEQILKILQNSWKNRQNFTDARYIVAIFLIRRDFTAAKNFAKTIKIPWFYERLQSDIFSAQQNFAEAETASRKAYKMHADPEDLANAAFFELKNLEQSTQKIPREKLQKILAEMSDAIVEIEQNRASIEDLVFAQMITSYGYALINHDVDIKKGVLMVQESLKIIPQNPLALDALSWGYYKQGMCELSQNTFAQIPKSVLKSLNPAENGQILEHFEKIKNCK